MEKYTSETYGERIAGIYDTWYDFHDETAIDLLCELAGRDRVLELGIGTGRIALPLKEKGVKIHGIDASASMIAKLHSKPAGKDIPVTSGDFSKVQVEGKYGLIFVVFNTFFGLTTQESQLECLRNVAEHLTAGGAFLIEAFVPDVGRFDRGQSVRAVALGENEVRIDVSKHNPVTQTVNSQHVLLTDEGVKLYPVNIRYAWPPELDMMAQLAGLKLAERWGGWDRKPFAQDSVKHISVYKLQ